MDDEVQTLHDGSLAAAAAAPIGNLNYGLCCGQQRPKQEFLMISLKLSAIPPTPTMNPMKHPQSMVWPYQRKAPPGETLSNGKAERAVELVEDQTRLSNVPSSTGLG